MGCPQSPDKKRCDHGLAQPNQSFMFSNTGTLLPLSGGGMLTTAYGVYRCDQAPSPHPTPAINMSVAVFHSSSGGESWEWISTAAGRSALHPGQVGCEGASENHVAQLSNGSLLIIFRVPDDTHRLCHATSNDGRGLSWSAGTPLRGGAPLSIDSGARTPLPLPHHRAQHQRAPWGVAPRLLRLPNGLLALTTGRPGIMLWLAPDPEQEKEEEGGGMVWRPFNLAAHHNRVLPLAQRFTSNCSSYSAAHPKGGGGKQPQCVLAGGCDLPGRAGSGSTTSYTGLTLAPAAAGVNSSSSSSSSGSGRCTVLISYDWLADGWQPIPLGAANVVYVLRLDIENPPQNRSRPTSSQVGG
jgi:hypothetical protein